MLNRTEVKRGAYAVAHFKNIAIFVWPARADGESARAGTDFANQLALTYSQFSVVHVVEETAGLPTPEGRDQFVATARAHKGRVACVGVLLPGATIVATLMRAFVRSVGTLLRGDLNAMVDHDLASFVVSFAAKHEQQTAARISAKDLAAAIEETRRLLA